MRPILYTMVLFTLLLASATGGLLAQESDSFRLASIGLTGGPLWSEHVNPPHFTIVDESAAEIDVTNGLGWSVGLRANIRRDGSRWSLFPSITYENRPFEQESRAITDTIPVEYVYRSPHGVTKTTEVLSTTHLDYELIAVDLLLGCRLLGSDSSSFSVVLGPSFRYMLRGDSRHELNLIAPAEAVFENPNGLETTTDNGRSLIFYDGPVSGVNRFHVALKGGVVAEFALDSGAWVVMPGLYVDYSLTELSEEGWNVHALSLQVDLRRNL